MSKLNRREVLGSMAASMMLGNAIAIEPKVKKITLGFSNYGMKTLAYKEAVPYVGKVGFDSMELCLLKLITLMIPPIPGILSRLKCLM